MPKPGDLYVGVLEFFSILLPGATLVALLIGTGLMDELTALLRLDHPGERYAAFLLGSYAAGHIVFLVAALLDEIIYLPIRRNVWPDREGDAYARASGLCREAVEGAGTLPMNTFSWCKSYLMLHWPAAWADVQRYEADSKFFRSMTLLLLVAVPILAARGERGLALVSLVLAGAACWRYAERRYKSTRWAYQHVIVHQSAQARPGTGAAQADGVAAAARR